MENFTIGPKIFTAADLEKIDPRFQRFLKGWLVTETYEGKTVIVPDCVPMNYFEVVDKPANDIQDNEKQLTLWLGWAGRSNGKDIDGLYDEEVIINLRIQGNDVLNTSNDNVVAEILKSGGAPMSVEFNGQFVTDFTSKFWWVVITNGYQVVNISSFK